jgi:hypothetical protein
MHTTTEKILEKISYTPIPLRFKTLYIKIFSFFILIIERIIAKNAGQG